MIKSKYQFFCKQPENLYLDESESNHAIKVLRLNIGDFINVLNGVGYEFQCEITAIHKNRLEFKIVASTVIEAPKNNFAIAIAPTKNIDRFEFFLEKTCEIGIEAIYPIKCKNSERKEIKIEKLNKTLIAALKQSGQLFLPTLHEMVTFKDIIEKAKSNYDEFFIAHCEENQVRIDFNNCYNPNKKTIILIGPEGDFSSEEINLAKQNGFVAISLGKSRLRTETAGIKACIIADLKKSS